MAIQDSKRLPIVLLHLYPNLKNAGMGNDGDYRLDDDGLTGTKLTWLSKSVAEPTDKELADAKEAAVNAHWYRLLRRKRDSLLVESDWTQGADVPSSIKNEYATYRAKLRDLPTTATKPNYSTLNGQNTKDWNIPSYMPTKPN
tara:strand:+ start:370 stop:798 length:429 start_codon:yes stop_codon:yes gene_type:complete